MHRPEAKQHPWSAMEPAELASSGHVSTSGNSAFEVAAKIKQSLVGGLDWWFGELNLEFL